MKKATIASLNVAQLNSKAVGKGSRIAVNDLHRHSPNRTVKISFARGRSDDEVCNNDNEVNFPWRIVKTRPTVEHVVPASLVIGEQF